MLTILAALAVVLALAALVLAWANTRRIGRERVRLGRIQRRFERAEADLLHLRKRTAVAQAGRQAVSNPDATTDPIAFHSQFGEDVYLWELFEGKPTGTFLEVGAYDGCDLSVTWAFEKIGWVGLLIEAIPERAEQCRLNRPRSTVVHTALGEPGSPDSIEFAVVEGTGSQGMLSYDPKGSRTTEHLDTIKAAGHTTTTVRVPMTTMDHVLNTHKDQLPSTLIDFAIVDVEGAELNLLKGWSLRDHKPRVLIVEDNTMGKDPAVLDYLRSKGYIDVCPLGLNIVFVHADETALLERARKMAQLIPWPNFGKEFGVGIGTR
jgi:FkbM family methyltransferase